MSTKNLLVFIGVVAVIVGFTILRPAGDVDAAPRERMKVEVIVEIGKETSVGAITSALSNIGSSGLDGAYRVDSFFDITYAANIGSSGLDGYRIDSFFDIDYVVEAKGVETEIVAMSLKCTLDDPDNPGGVIDAVRIAVEKAGGNLVHGHVTVLK